jgi:hypothetical protein
MTLGDAIFAKLSNAAAVKGLVGNRIFPVTNPDRPQLPYIIFNLLAATPATTHSEPAELSLHLVQFSCWDESYEGAAGLREALITALDNQTLANGEIADLDDAGRDDFDQAAQLYRCDADFNIPHRH